MHSWKHAEDRIHAPMALEALYILVHCLFLSLRVDHQALWCLGQIEHLFLVVVEPYADALNLCYQFM